MLLLLCGCPSTRATAPLIDTVDVVVGEANETAFTLEVTGRGFGLKSVQYNVSNGQGVAQPTELALGLFLGPDERKRIPTDRIALESPRKLMADVRLTQPLRDGLYDVALFERGEEVTRKMGALSVPMATATTTPPNDAGVEDADISKDATPIPDGDIPDAGFPDADPLDTGPIDTGPIDTGPVDSGLGPFAGNFSFRRLIIPNNTVEAPADVTIEVPVDHAQVLSSTVGLPGDGADLAVYQGGDRLDHQWQDRFEVGTDQLVIVARLVRTVPVGGSPTDPLVLYYGDANATLTVTDGVFQFAERFNQPVDNNWFEANNWVFCNVDRPVEMIDPNNPNAYCVVDATSGNLVRQTLATPNQNDIVAAPGMNVTYEMSFWTAGQSVDGPADILYFAYGPDNDVFPTTTEPPLNAWAGFVPNGTLTFQDNDNQQRTVDGWRYPQATIQWWQRTTLRWVPTIDDPTLHFRHVSTDPNNSNQSFVGLDDWWVRKALDPDFAPTLGPVETR